MRKIENLYDIVGSKIGDLEILDYLGSYNYFGAECHVYLTKCRCGKVKAIRRDSLIGHRSKSCGHTNHKSNVGIAENWRINNEDQNKR